MCPVLNEKIVTGGVGAQIPNLYLLKNIYKHLQQVLSLFQPISASNLYIKNSILIHITFYNHTFASNFCMLFSDYICVSNACSPFLKFFNFKPNRDLLQIEDT